MQYGRLKIENEDFTEKIAETSIKNLEQDSLQGRFDALEPLTLVLMFLILFDS